VWPGSLGGFAGDAARRLAAWALADVGPGRLTPWLAVSFGFGIVLYFAAEQEPALWAAVALAVGAIAAAVLEMHRRVCACLPVQRTPTNTDDIVLTCVG